MVADRSNLSIECNKPLERRKRRVAPPQPKVPRNRRGHPNSAILPQSGKGTTAIIPHKAREQQKHRISQASRKSTSCTSFETTLEDRKILNLWPEDLRSTIADHWIPLCDACTPALQVYQKGWRISKFKLYKNSDLARTCKQQAPTVRSSHRIFDRTNLKSASAS